MSPFDQVVLLILATAAVIGAGCFLVAWVDIAIHSKHKPSLNPQEMRRYMLCGFYCNPEDPRPVVHRPLGWGYTMNLRRETLAVTLLIMFVLVLIAGLIVALVPAVSQ